VIFFRCIFPYYFRSVATNYVTPYIATVYGKHEKIM